MTWMDLWPYAKEVGSLLGAGVIGGLLTARYQWGIEKQKQILLRRRELVSGWRLTLIPMIGQAQDNPVVWAGQRQRAVMASPYYASLRRHLSDSALAQIEDPTLKLFVNLDKTKMPTYDWQHHFPLKIFIDEIDRIEKKWNLVG